MADRWKRPADTFRDQCCWKCSWIFCGDKMLGSCRVKAKACWLASHRNMAHITLCKTHYWVSSVSVNHQFTKKTSMLALCFLWRQVDQKRLFPCMEKAVAELFPIQIFLSWIHTQCIKLYNALEIVKSAFLSECNSPGVFFTHKAPPAQ